MGKAVGFSCDREGCNMFQAVPGADPPEGWINIRPQASASVGSTDTLLLCSNFCAAVVMIERHEGEMGVMFKRPTRRLE